MVKNPPTNAGDTRDTGSISGLERFLGVGNGNPLQYSPLENSMDREAWRATVHGVARLATTEQHFCKDSSINQWTRKESIRLTHLWSDDSQQKDKLIKKGKDSVF